MATILPEDTGVFTSPLTAPTPSMKLGNMPEAGNPMLAEMLRPALTRENEEKQALEKFRREKLDQTHQRLVDFGSYEPDESEEVRKRALISAHLMLNYGLSAKNSDAYKIHRDAVARKEFGTEIEGSDDAFFAKIQEQAMEKKETVDFLSGAVSQGAVLSTLAGGDSKSMSAFMSENAANPVISREREAVISQWKATQEGLQEQYADALPEIRKTWAAMNSGGDFLTVVAEAGKRLDDDERMNFLHGLRELAMANPSPALEEGFLRFGINIKKSVGRGIGGAARNAALGTAGMVREGDETFGLARFIGGEDAARAESEQSAEDKRWAKFYRENQDFIADARSVFESEYDPVRPLATDGSKLRAIEDGAYALPGAVTTTGIAMIPILGGVATYGGMREAARQKYRQRFLANGMSRDEAATMAGVLSDVSAVPNMLLERFQANMVLGKAPGLSKAIGKADAVIKSRIARGFAKFGIASVGETSTELAQELVDEAVQDIAHEFQKEIPSVEWKNGKDGVFDGYFNNVLTTFVAVAPLSIGTAMHGLSAEKRAQMFRESPRSVKRAAGYRDEDIDAIDNADGDAELVRALQRAMDNRDAFSPEAKAATEELADTQERQRAAVETAMSEGILPSVRAVAGRETVDVYDAESGEVISEDVSRNEAAEFVASHLQGKDSKRQDFIDALVAQIEGSQSLLDERGEGTTEIEPYKKLTEAMAAEEFEGSQERIERESALLEQVEGGDGSVSRIVLGASLPAGYRSRQEQVNKLFAGSNLFAAIHEHTHETRRRLMREGAFTKEEQISEFQRLDTSLAATTFTETRDGERVERSGETLRFLPANFSELSEQEQETALDEAMSHIAETLVLRTRNGKKTKFRELLSKNLSAQVAIGNPSAIKLKAFVRAMREWFGLNLQRSRAIKQLERDGVLDSAELDALSDRIFGTSQQESYEQEVSEDYTQLVTMGDGSVVEIDVPFSLGKEAPSPRMIFDKEAAREIAKSEIVGKEITNRDDQSVATVSNSSLNKMLSGKALGKSNDNAAHAFAVANVDHLYERAIRMGSESSTEEDTSLKQVHRYKSPFKNRGEVSVAKLTVKEFVQKDQGNRIYSVEVEAIENPTSKEASLTSQVSTALAGSEEKLQSKIEEIKKTLRSDKIGSSASPADVAAYREAYEQGDEGAAQRMVDKAAKKAGFNTEGWHNSGVRFDKFDLSKARTSSDIQAFFFNGARDPGKEYGPEESRVYIKLENPANEKAALAGFEPGSTNDAGIKQREKLISQGYDGAILKAEWAEAEHDEIIAFHPNQIKSADPFTFDENGELIPLSERFNDRRDEIGYALGNAKMADALIGDALSRMKDPEARSRIMERMSERLEALKRETDEVKRAFGKEYARKAIVDPRKKKSLRKEASMREATRRQELEDEASARHGDILQSEELTKLKEQPVHRRLSIVGNPLKGELMSRSRAIKEGKFNPKRHGDYDGADGVSRTVFGGRLMPDQAAQELYNEGLLPEPTIEALWEALEQEQASVSNRKSDLATAKEDMRSARQQAKTEAAAWLETATKEQERDNNPMARVRRSLAMLDAILTAMPTELRGKVGGYVQIAKLNTDEKRLEELQKRLEKADKVIEAYLRREADKGLRKLFKRAEARRREAGKSDKGKLDGVTHTLFGLLHSATGKTEDEVEAMVITAEAALAKGEEIDSETYTLNLMLTSLLPQFANWNKRTASDRIQALKNGWNVYFQAMTEAHAREEERRERNQSLRAGFIADSGVKANEKTLQAAARRDKKGKLGTKAYNWELNLAGFELLLEKIFGVNSSLAARATEGQREAEMKRSQLRYEASEKANNFFRERAGSELKGARLHAALHQPTVQTKKGELSEMQGLTATMMWMQPDGRRHMEGSRGEDGNVTSSWSYDQDFIDGIESQLSNTAKDFREFLLREYEEGYQPINEVYKRVNLINLPKVSNYSPIGVKPFMEASENDIDPFTGVSSSQAGYSPSFSNRRSVSAVARPVFNDAFSVFISHTASTSHYIAFAEFSKEMNAVLGQREVLDHVEVKGGQQARIAIKTWTDMFAKGGVASATSRLALNRDLLGSFGRMAKMALYLKGSVSLVQSTILGGAIIDLPVKSYLKGLAKLASGQLEIRNAFKTDFIQRRFKDQPVIMQVLNKQDPSRPPSTLEYWVEKIAHLGISGADALFTSATYVIYEDHYKKEAAELGLEGAELEKYVEQKTVTNTERVSQPTRSGTRSLVENQESSPWKIIGMAFASDSRMKAALTLHRVKYGSKAEKARALVFFYILNGIGATLVRNIWRDARDDDDDELFDAENWDMKTMMVASLFGPLNGVPLLGEKIEYFASTLAGERTFLGDLTDSISKGARPIKNAGDYLEGGIEVDRALRDAEAILTTAGTFNDQAASAKAVISLLRDSEKLRKNVFKDD